MTRLRLRSTKQKRKIRTSSKLRGDAKKPRLSIFRSNKYIYGQIIDDTNQKTLVDVFAEAKKLHKGKNKTEAAFAVGEALAKKAKEKKITTVNFDRGSYKFHGRVASFAQGARKGGLTF